jgi:uncharacterized RDD family membrane protein YckC
LSTFTPVISNPPSTSEPLPPNRPFGALWRRAIALAIDGVIVGSVELAITFKLFETVSRLGWWGPVVGFWLALPYFAVLNSSIGNGQTLGKRLMHVQVIGREGATISLWSSVIRYTVLAVPLFLDEMVLPISRTPWVISALFSVLVFGLGGATLYLLLFNRRTRQGLHDLAAGSYVAEANSKSPLKIESIWEGHWVILGLLLLILSLFIKGGRDNLERQEALLPQLFEDVQLVEGMEGVQAATVQDVNQSESNDGKKKILVVTVYWLGKSASRQSDTSTWLAKFGKQREDGEAFASQVAKLVIEHDSTVEEHDLLKVVIIRSCNLGVAHSQVSYPYQHAPAEWHALLFGASGDAKAAASKP